MDPHTSKRIQSPSKGLARLPVMQSTRVATLLVLSILLSPGGVIRAQQDSASFLMVKLGDPAATADLAAPFLDLLTTCLASHVEKFVGTTLIAHISNREVDAVRLLAEQQPILTFVSPGFYLQHLRAPELKAEVVAQMPRFGSSVERYHLVVRKDSPAQSLTDLQGKTVHTSRAIDWPYLKRVVFTGELLPGEDFVLEPSKNLSDDLFAMTEVDDDESAPDALLFDSELLQFFASDDLIWPQLTVIWTSVELPRDLVVTLGADWNVALREQLFSALQGMPEHDDGRKVLDLMQSRGFARPGLEQLASTAKSYDAAGGEHRRR